MSYFISFYYFFDRSGYNSFSKTALFIMMILINQIHKRYLYICKSFSAHVIVGMIKVKLLLLYWRWREPKRCKIFPMNLIYYLPQRIHFTTRWFYFLRFYATFKVRTFCCSTKLMHVSKKLPPALDCGQRKDSQ